MESYQATPGRREPSAVRASAPPLRTLLWFTAPLTAVVFLHLLGRQVVLRGLAQRPGAETDLAAFVVAFALIMVICSPVQGLHMLTLAWGGGPAIRRRLNRFAGVIAVASSCVVAYLSCTASGHASIVALQGLSDDLASRVQAALLPMIFWPPLMTVMAMTTGSLKREGHSAWLAGAHVAGLATIGAVVWLSGVAGWAPLPMATAALLLALLARVSLLLYCVRRFIGTEADARTEAAPPSWKVMACFYLPIAANTLLMLASRPLIQAFLAGLADPAAVLAGFGVATMLGELCYSWINELRSQAVAFREQPAVRAKIPHFAALTCGAVTAAMALCFWTPLSRPLLRAAFVLDGEVLEQAAGAMGVLVLAPLVVGLRSVYQGEAIYLRRTGSYIASGLLRVALIAALMWILLGAGLSGAVAGAWSIIGGFTAEAFVLAAVLHRRAPEAATAHLAARPAAAASGD
ncbi:MAG: hypothetical protein L6R28_05755 [Planctomycetes bacterium]|nr:hypothetical protein [Planctomycetota bacterium]